MSEPRPEERGPDPRREGLPALLVAVVGTLCSLVLWRALERAEARDARGIFELAASQRVARVQRERTVALEQLRSVEALFNSSQTVEPDEFRTFTADALERNDALRALLWIVHEPPDRVVFAEGPEHASLAPGSDPSSRPEVRDALARIARTGELSLSAPLSSSADGRTRVFAALPVRYHEGERSGELQGFVGLLLDAERLLSGADEVQLEIEDVTDAAPVRMAGTSAREGLRTASEPEELGGRRWRIVGSASTGFVARHTSRWPLVAFLLGLLATASAALTLRMASSRKRAEDLVERRKGEMLQSYATLAAEAKERREAEREAMQSREQLREILDLVPIQIYVKDRHGRMLVANQATADAYDVSVQDLTLPADVDVNADAGDPSDELKRDRLLLDANKGVIVPAQPFVDGKGRRRVLHVAKIPCRAQGGPALLHVATDVTERRQAEELLNSQNGLLARLASGAPPDEVLLQVIQTAERLVPGLRCSVLYLSPDRRHLVHGLAPSLPAEYSRAVEGLEIGPMAGSCGAAAHLGERVIVRDVLQHPNWTAYREHARRANLRACWSEPIRASDGEILGTFAMYYSEPRVPEPYEERFIESMAYLAGLAIERGRLSARA